MTPWIRFRIIMATNKDVNLLPCWTIDVSKPFLESENIKQPDIFLVDLHELKEHGSFPEFPKCAKKVSELDLENSMVVMASHAWISMPARATSRKKERVEEVKKVDTSKFMFEGEVDESSEEEVEERPQTPEACTKEYTLVDTLANDKYHLYVEALEKMKEELCPDMDCVYLWMDYCCLDQGRSKGSDWVDNICPIETLNNIPDNGDLILFDRVVRLADCLLTCVYDHAFKHTPWTLTHSGNGLHEDYQAPLWRRYLSRRWCRLEMAYSAHVPFEGDEKMPEYDEESIEAKRSETKNDVFDRRLNPLVGRGINRADRMSGALQYERLQGRRAHFIYGTRESHLNLSPKLLPVLTKEDVITKYNPSEGPHSRAEDGFVLEKLERELWPFTRRGESGYEGERDLWAVAGGVGRKHGQGTMCYPNGNIYRGEWVKNHMQGKGVYSYYQGEGYTPDIYEGMFHEDVQHGEGTYTRRDGTMYRGEWHCGKRQGFGYYRWSDGSEYRGYFHDDERHGFGKLQAANGNLYEGFWHRGRRNGQGRMKWADGTNYDGEWRNDLRHGKGVGFDPFGRGAEYDGEWEDGMKMGRGKLTIGKGVIAKPQVLQGLFSCDNYMGSEEDYYEGGEEKGGGENEEGGTHKHADRPASPVSLGLTMAPEAAEREKKRQIERNKMKAIENIFDLDSEEEREEERAVEEDLLRMDREAEERRSKGPGKDTGVAFFAVELTSSMIKPRQRRK